MVEGGIGTFGVLYLRDQLDVAVLAGAGAYVLGQGLATTTRWALGCRGAATSGCGAAAAAGRRGSGSAVAAVGLVLEAATDLPGGRRRSGWPSRPSGVTRVLAAAVGRRQPVRRTGPASPSAAVSAAGYLGFLAGPPVVGAVADGAGLRAGVLVLAVAAAVAASIPLRTIGARRSVDRRPAAQEAMAKVAPVGERARAGRPAEVDPQRGGRAEPAPGGDRARSAGRSPRAGAGRGGCAGAAATAAASCPVAARKRRANVRGDIERPAGEVLDGERLVEVGRPPSRGWGRGCRRRRRRGRGRRRTGPGRRRGGRARPCAGRRRWRPRRRGRGARCAGTGRCRRRCRPRCRCRRRRRRRAPRGRRRWRGSGRRARRCTSSASWPAGRRAGPASARRKAPEHTEMRRAPRRWAARSASSSGGVARRRRSRSRRARRSCRRRRGRRGGTA